MTGKLSTGILDKLSMPWRRGGAESAPSPFLAFSRPRRYARFAATPRCTVLPDKGQYPMFASENTKD